MNSQANFNAVYGRELIVFGNGLVQFLGAFAAWYKELEKAMSDTPAKAALDKLGISAKLANIENIVYTTGHSGSAGQPYMTYKQMAGVAGAESAFAIYRNDVNAFFSQIDSVLTPFENYAKANPINTAAFEARKASIDSVIAAAEPFSDAYNKAMEEKARYQSIEKLFGSGKAPFELYNYVMLKTNEVYNPPAPVKVTIESTNIVELVKTADKPQEVVTVAKTATDSAGQPVVVAALPTTQAGTVQTTKALDQSTGNVVEIVTDKQNLPVTKTATVEDTSKGTTTTQALALNAEGQPVATVVTDSKGTPQTVIDPITKTEMPVVNTAMMPQAIQQAVSSPQATAVSTAVQTSAAPVQNAAAEVPPAPKADDPKDLTKPLVVFGVAAVIAITGYFLIK